MMDLSYAITATQPIRRRHTEPTQLAHLNDGNERDILL